MTDLVVRPDPHLPRWQVRVDGNLVGFVVAEQTGGYRWWLVSEAPVERLFRPVVDHLDAAAAAIKEATCG